MSNGAEDTGRDIKPQTAAPARQDEIVEASHPDIAVSHTTASRLLGVKRPYLKQTIRQSFGETASEPVNGELLSRLYSLVRPDESLLCDAHFVTDDGQRGLERLAGRIESEGGANADDAYTPAVYQGDALRHIDAFPDGSVQTVITSPPYWGARVYPESHAVEWADGQTVPFGGEQTPEAYIRHTVEMFERVRRPLADDGVVWWNVSDVRNTRTRLRDSSSDIQDEMRGDEYEGWDVEANRYSAGHEYLRDTHPTLIPTRLARALERAGWYVQSVVTWEKVSAVPEPASSRPADTHEKILMVSPSSSPKFDEDRWRKVDGLGSQRDDEAENLRSVWRLPTADGTWGHAAPFSPELPARCLLCSTEQGDVVYDPFMGSGSTAVAVEEYGRDWIGSEIATEYVEMVERRLAGHSPDKRGQTSIEAY